jgi:hypothetical protein
MPRFDRFGRESQKAIRNLEEVSIEIPFDKVVRSTLTLRGRWIAGNNDLPRGRVNERDPHGET